MRKTKSLWEVVTLPCVALLEVVVTCADSTFPIRLNWTLESESALFQAAICCRSRNFCTLPVTVIGNESTNFT